uniref:Uncharacterized protein n=1 Tax=Callorhinchus milii TaxID=7868 RepID=A0A4W3IWB5_CALMI
MMVYPRLREGAAQIHSRVTGSYLSGSHSMAFITCPNEQVAKDIDRALGHPLDATGARS